MPAARTLAGDGVELVVAGGHRPQFAAEYGLTPKVMGRVMRFERANRMLRGETRPTLTEVAAACGYTDQAHFNRDWRALCGATPTEWIATELPFVQGGEADAVAELWP